MAKITLNNLANLQNETSAVNTINNNSDTLETAFENTLSRNGQTPNQMNASLDMNSNQILNLPAPATLTSPLRYKDLVNFVGGGVVSNIPSGGVDGQFLGKTSSVDYSVGWITVPSNFDSLTIAQNSSIPSDIDHLSIAGYVEAGDGGGALYKRSVSEPTHAGKFQSFDGAWWEISEDVVTPEMFGALGDGTDDYQAFVRAFTTPAKILQLGSKSYSVGTVLVVPEDLTIVGKGQEISIIQGMSRTQNVLILSSNTTLLNLSVVGMYSTGGTDGGSGVYLKGTDTLGNPPNYVENVTIDNVTIRNNDTQGLAMRYARNCQIGKIRTHNNGHRGVNCSAESNNNTFGQIIAYGNGLAQFLIGYGCYRNTVGQLLLSGGTEPALWIMGDSRRNTIGEVIINAPDVGYEDNSSIVLGWHSHSNYIGRVTSRGWRRGIQFLAATVPTTSYPELDAVITNGNTEENTIGSAWIETDGGSNAAGVYFTSANSYIVMNNKILSLHVKNSTYGVWDLVGDSASNVFIEQTFDTVTTPFSLPSLGTNKGFFRGLNGYLGIDNQDPAGAIHGRKNITGDYAVIAENSNTAATTSKTVSFQGRHRDTVGTSAPGAIFSSVPLDNDAVNVKAVVKVRKDGVTTDGFQVHSDGPFEMGLLSAAPGGTQGRMFGNTTDNLPYYHNGTTWRRLPLQDQDASFATVTGIAFTMSHPSALAQEIITSGMTASNGQTINRIAFQGKDDAGTINQNYARINIITDDVTAASKDGSFEFSTVIGNTFASRFKLGAGFYYTAGTDPGAGNFNAALQYNVAGTKVVGARDTGWVAMTGTADENTVYATSSVTLPQLAGRVMALQAALTTHGLIGT